MSGNRLIMPAGYDGTALSGIPSTPRQVWSSGMPLSEQQGRIPVLRKWPISKAEDESITVTTYDGRSNSEMTVMSNIILRIWSDRNYHNEIRDGDPIFILNGLVENEKQSQAALNLRHVNQWFADYWARGEKRFTDTAEDAFGETKPKVVLSGILSEETYKVMKEVPTTHWKNIRALAQARDTPSHFAAIHELDHLAQEIVSEHFNWYGFVRGQVPENLHVKQVAISRSGRVDDVPNYWGEHVINGMKLYWIFKRRYNPMTGKYGPYGFWPFAAFHDPTDADLLYIDFTGHLAKGKPIYVGRLIRWTENWTMDEDHFEQIIGGKPLTREYLLANGPRGTLRILMAALPCRKIPWLVG